MSGRHERNCQVRMSPTLWSQLGEVAQEHGYQDPRGRHSAIIREFLGSATAIWRNSPYVCRSSHNTVYVTRDGDIFARDVQELRLNTARERLPCSIEMKAEKRDDYHSKYKKSSPGKRKTRPKSDEFQWFLSRWLFNHFSAWSGKKDPYDLNAFQQAPLSSHIDTYGTTSKSADLAVHAIGGRSLTREVIVGLRDYVQWKEAGTPIFDRIETPIDIPTINLELSVVIDQELFSAMDVSEMSNLALEFRNRESARFEGKEVALSAGTEIDELSGRSMNNDEGADEMLLRIRRLRQRVDTILKNLETSGSTLATGFDKSDILNRLELPKHFFYYRLRWPYPQLGIETCVRWEKPFAKQAQTRR